MKKTYIKPESEAVVLQVESPLLAGSLEMDETKPVENETDVLSNKQGFGNALWE